MSDETKPGLTGSQSRLIDNLADRYRAGDTLEYLAADCELPLEQVRWGVLLSQAEEREKELGEALRACGAVTCHSAPPEYTVRVWCPSLGAAQRLHSILSRRRSEAGDLEAR